MAFSEKEKCYITKKNNELSIKFNDQNYYYFLTNILPITSQLDTSQKYECNLIFLWGEKVSLTNGANNN